MKKVILVIIILGAQIVTFGQKGDINLKLVGGINRAQIVGNGVYDSTHSIDNNIFGVNLSFGLNKHMSLNTGVSQEIKGYHTKKRIVDINGNYQYDALSVYSLKYLVIPININYTAWSKNRHSIYASFGGYLGFLQKDSFEFQSQEEIFPPIKSSIEHNSFDAGLNLGIGYQYQFKEKLRFSLEVMNSQGLLSINDNRNYNNSTSVVLGVCYRIRNKSGE